LKNLIKISALLLVLLILSSFKFSEYNKDFKNGFSYSDQFFELSKINIFKGNGAPNHIQLYKKGNDNSTSNFSGVFFCNTGPFLQDVPLTNILGYSASINSSKHNKYASIDRLILKENQPILSAKKSSLNIQKLTSNTIKLSFSFISTDGEEIKGSYDIVEIVKIDDFIN